MPLAIYLLYLAHLNGRTPPTLVPGPWDFGAVLLGLSGFLLLAGPLLITLADSAWRGYAFGGGADLRAGGRQGGMSAPLVAPGYLLARAGGGLYPGRARPPGAARHKLAAPRTPGA